MTSDPPQLKAHQISDSRSGTAYFVLVKLREDPNDFEASTIDVRVTDGRCCWSTDGMPFLTCLITYESRMCLRGQLFGLLDPLRFLERAQFYHTKLYHIMGIAHKYLHGAGLHSQPAPKAWMKNVYNALSGSSKDSYEIQVQSSTAELKVGHPTAGCLCLCGYQP